MKFFFGLILSVIFLSSYSQDTLYFQKIEDSIRCAKENAHYFKVIDKSMQPVEVSLFHSNGVKISTAHYASVDLKVLDGTYESFFDNGSTEVKGYFQKNLMEGIWVEYDKEKYSLKEKVTYLHNLRNGKDFNFYENGKLKSLDIYRDGELASSSCFDTLGKPMPCIAADSIHPDGPPEIMPQFPGGVPALLQYLFTSIRPQFLSKEKGLQGKVKVKFYIDVDGSVRNPVVLMNETGSEEYAQEAIRVVLSMPKWTPGFQKGKPVKVYYTLPVNFKTTQ